MLKYIYLSSVSANYFVGFYRLNVQKAKGKQITKNKDFNAYLGNKVSDFTYFVSPDNPILISD